jgi:DNA polymerase
MFFFVLCFELSVDKKMQSVEGDLRKLILSVKEHVIQLQKTGVTYFPRSQFSNRPTHDQLIEQMLPSHAIGESLRLLQHETIGDCRLCGLCSTRTHIVFGEGNPKARLVFVGEAPGADEDAKGRPFIGKAGQLLTKMIEAMGLKREDIYICNVVKCRPPENRDPLPEEVSACEPFLKRQLALIEPDVVVTLGRYASQCLLKNEVPISRLRGQWASYEGIAIMPTFHPAFLLRNPEKKREVWEDLQEVMKRLAMPMPFAQ